MKSKKPLIVIVGPTASGKSALAISLARKFSGEIICADSRTVYRGMFIGTASPCLNLQNRPIASKNRVFSAKLPKQDNAYLIGKIPHYLLHFAKPDEIFTVAQFQEMAGQIIKNILKRDKLPFLVGGTGLYIDAVTKGLTIPRVPPNPKLRARLEKMSNKMLAAELKMLDKKSASKIDPANKRRLIRALEVCLTTGRPFSKQQKTKRPNYKILTIGIEIPRQKLYQRIDQRVDEMIRTGLVDEVKRLIANGYKLNLPSMSGLGYKQIAEYLSKNPNHPVILFSDAKSGSAAKAVSSNHLDEISDFIKRETRHFARRQISWFKRDKSINWIKNKKEAERLIKKAIYNNKILLL